MAAAAGSWVESLLSCAGPPPFLVLAGVWLVGGSFLAKNRCSFKDRFHVAVEGQAEVADFYLDRKPLNT